MRARLLLPTLAVLALFLAACGGDDDADTSADTPVEDTASEGAADPGESGPAPDEASDDETSSPDGEETACSNSVAVVNAEAETEVSGLTDGPIDVAWTLSEGGPHPANTVDDDRNADLAFASYGIEPDEQFGPSIPVGPPGAPDGELFVQISLFSPDGPIEVGQTYVDQIDYDDDPSLADGKINFYAAYLGPDRLLPGDVTVEITELTDTEICVDLVSVTQTDLQTFVGFEGSVAFEREQSIDDG